MERSDRKSGEVPIEVRGNLPWRSLTVKVDNFEP